MLTDGCFVGCADTALGADGGLPSSGTGRILTLVELRETTS